MRRCVDDLSNAGTPGHRLNRALAPAARAALDALSQCAQLLESITQPVFVRPSPVMFNGTIGQHVRHCLDHFAAALVALEGETIDYDRRERGTLIETDLAGAIRELNSIRAALAQLDEPRGAMPVRVRVMVDASGAEAEHASTLGREIAFAAHHAIHHHAMIAAIARDASVPVPRGFGKAPSTLKHEHDTAPHH